MAIFVSTPLYPDVPIAPGVPPVLRNPSGGPQPTPTAPVTADAPGVVSQQAPMWGIYDQNLNPVIVGDNVVRVDLKRDATIADFPVEAGGFGSYDKVQRPFDARIVLSKGGTVAERTTFLNAIDAAWKSLSLYSVVMPEFTYPSANVVRYETQREATNGVTLLIVAIYLEEVRVSADTTFTSVNQGNSGQGSANSPPPSQQVLFPKQPSGASPTNGGWVQTKPAPAGVPSPSKPGAWQ